MSTRACYSTGTGMTTPASWPRSGRRSAYEDDPADREVQRAARPALRHLHGFEEARGSRRLERVDQPQGWRPVLGVRRDAQRTASRSRPWAHDRPDLAGIELEKERWRFDPDPHLQQGPRRRPDPPRPRQPPRRPRRANQPRMGEVLLESVAGLSETSPLSHVDERSRGRIRSRAPGGGHRRGNAPAPARHAAQPRPRLHAAPPGRDSRRAGRDRGPPRRGRSTADRAPLVGGPACLRDPRRLRLRGLRARAARLSVDGDRAAGVPAGRDGAEAPGRRRGGGARPLARLVLPLFQPPESAPSTRPLGPVVAETFQNLYLGFSVALTPTVLFYAFVGCVIGTLVGVLPGVGPLAGISLLLPATFGLNATNAIVLLAGIYYGAMYGGSTTSILMRIPGEAASVMTCIDGYEMTKKGRAGPALAIAAVGSYIAGTLSIVGLMFLAPPLASFALRFGPPEYFALLVLGLLVLAYMSSGSMPKALAMAALGLLLGMVGIDTMTGFFRFHYGLVELGDGIGVVPVAVGLFGISEILLTAGLPTPPAVHKPKLRELLPSRQEWRDSAAPIRRGTLPRFLIGIIPGSAHIISSFVSYALERRLSKHPERFGQGAVEGVAGPESANNSATSGAFV